MGQLTLHLLHSCGLRVKKFVDENNRTSSITDSALFMWHHNDKFIGVMTVHVDDFLYAGTDLFYLKHVSAIFYQFFIFSSNDSPSKTITNVFYFIEKALFVLEIFNFS